MAKTQETRLKELLKASVAKISRFEMVTTTAMPEQKELETRLAFVAETRDKQRRKGHPLQP